MTTTTRLARWIGLLIVLNLLGTGLDGNQSTGGWTWWSSTAHAQTADWLFPNAGPDQRVSVGDTVLLDGSESASEDFFALQTGARLTYTWSFVSVPAGSTAVVSDTSAVLPSFNVDLDGDYVVQLVISDGTGTSAPDTVRVSTVNGAPIARADVDQEVSVGDGAVLDGTASTDPDGDLLTYTWTLQQVPSGSNALIINANRPRARIIPDVAGNYRAELVVSDGTYTSAPDTTVVSANWFGIDGLALDAGPDIKASVGDTVTLPSYLTFLVENTGYEPGWVLLSQPSTSTATVTGGNQLTIDQPGTYVAQLFNDFVEGDAPPPDPVVITTGNTRAVADAGADQVVVPSDVVQLRADASTDLDGDQINYSWSLLSVPFGSSAAISDPSNVAPRFTADAPGDYVAQLTVSDGQGGLTRDTVVVTTGNARPVVDAGRDQAITVGQMANLSGSDSADANLDPLTYEWFFVRVPDASGLFEINNDLAVDADFTPDVPGQYVVQLTVRDGTQRSGPGLVTLDTDNTPPVASAGQDQAVDTGATVTLDGSASSDAQASNLVFSWALVSTPAASTAQLTGATTAAPSFVADLSGTYVVQLLVTEDAPGGLRSQPDTVAIFVGDPAPVADAGPDQNTFVNEIVRLDGSGSTVAEGRQLSFNWQLVSTPLDSQAVLSSTTSVRPTFLVDKSGSYQAQLVVSDGLTQSAASFVTVTTQNRQPIASAGPDQRVKEGATVELNGSASRDPDNDLLTFQWEVTSAPATGQTMPSSLIASGSGTQVTLDRFLAEDPSRAPVSVDYVGSDTGKNGTGLRLTSMGRLLADDGRNFNVWRVRNNSDDVRDVVLNEVGTGLNQDLNLPVRSDTYAISFVTGGPDTHRLFWNGEQIDVKAAGPQEFTSDILIDVGGGTGVELSDPSALNPTFVADAAGTYVVELVVNDGALDSEPDTVTITVDPTQPLNDPPVLDPIGPQVVALGATLQLQLTASDPNAGDALMFSAQPLPLPDGAELIAQAGAFSFTPGSSQAGDIVVTFFVSDGLASDSESVLITVQDVDPADPTVVSGRVLDQTDFAGGVETPVVGAVVSLRGDPTTVTTDANGAFSLSGVAAGSQRVEVDAAAANPAPDGSAYAPTSSPVQLVASATNALGAPLLLARIDATSATTVDPASTTVVSNPGLGVSVEIAADSLRDSNGDLFTGQVTISAINPKLAGNLPPLFSPCQLLTLQPEGLSFSPPAKITLPNVDNLAPGTTVDLWSFTPATGQVSIVGRGTVNPAGTQIETTTGGLNTTGSFAAAAPAPSASLSADYNPTRVSPTELNEGNLTQTVTLVGYQSVGESRELTFVYNSTSADPQPIVAADATILERGGIPGLIEGRVELGGIDVSGTIFTSTDLPSDPNDPGLSEAQDEELRQAIQFDAQELPTGDYPYRFVSTANFGCTRIGSLTRGRVLVNNQIESPFGAGWTLDGLQQLHIQEDGTAVVTEGDGSTTVFAAERDVTAYSNPLLVSVDGLVGSAIADLSNDGNTDVLVTEAFLGNVTSFVNDGAGLLTKVDSFQVAQPVPNPGGGSFTPDTVTVATADFDEDGILDFAVANQTSNNAKIFLGRGGGTFGTLAQTLQFSTAEAVDVDTADLNNDGHQDLVVTTQFDVRIYVGDGTGQVSFVADYDILQGVASDIADFNGDGAPDIAAVGTGLFGIDTGFRLLTNDGTANFSNVSVAGFPVRRLFAQFLDTGDINGDGAPDVVFSDRSANARVFFNNGSGGFSFDGQQSFATTLGETASVQLADLNQDGVLDIVASDRSSTNLAILKGDGVGGFSAPQIAPGFQSNAKLYVTDMDGDGQLDVVADAQGGFLAVHLADPQLSGVFIPPLGDFSTFAQNPDGTFTRRLKEGTELVFNAEGLMIQKVEITGNTTTYDYDGQGRLISVTDPAGRVTNMVYNGPGGRLSSVTNPAGSTTTFEHAPDGTLLKINEPDGELTEFSYDEQLRMTAKTTPRLFTTDFRYGAGERFVGADFPDSSSIRNQVAQAAGIADLGLGLGTETNPAPYVREAERFAVSSDAKGNRAILRLDSFGNVIQAIDRLGRDSTFERDENGLITRSIVPSDGEVPNGLNAGAGAAAAAAATPGELISTFEYDNRGNVLVFREAVGTTLERETRFEYEPTFNKVVRIDEPGTEADKLFFYDINGNLEAEEITIPDINFPEVLVRREFTYDNRGLRQTAKDGNENTTQLFYDQFGILIEVVDPEGNVIEFTPDIAGNIAKVIVSPETPSERSIELNYDEMNRLVLFTDGEGGSTELTYDASGNITEILDANGLLRLQTYDEIGRISSVQQPGESASFFNYDLNGNLSSYIDPLDRRTDFEYDAGDRLVKQINALLQEREFEYDRQDNLKQITDARNNITSFNYDILSRLVSETSALNQSRVYSYDARDNVQTVADPKQQILTYIYDERSRLTKIVAPDNEITATYDKENNLLSVNDDDSSIEFTYDGVDRPVTARTIPVLGGGQPASVLEYTYDQVGDLVEVASSGGPITSYGYDGAGRVTSLLGPNGNVFFDYDAEGRLLGLTYGNGVTTEFIYDINGRLSELNHGGGLSPFQVLEFGYDASGKVISIGEGAETRSFGYDELARLVAGGSAAAPEAYTYDPEGNRLTSHLSLNHVVDAANRLLEDDRACYGYDANGNLATRTDKVGGACTGGITTYTYDAFDQLIQIAFSDGRVANYAYDGLNRRIEKDIDGQATRYIYDRENIVLEYDGTNTLRARYGHGPGADQPLVMERDGSSWFFHADQIGSLRRVTDSAGFLANTYDYDSYGNAQQQVETVDVPYGFTGRERDPESELYYYRARYYDPHTGRFLSEDPLGYSDADINLYRYVFNNPVNFVDPFGEAAAVGSANQNKQSAKRAPAKAVIGRAVRCLIFKGASAIRKTQKKFFGTGSQKGIPKKCQIFFNRILGNIGEKLVEWRFRLDPRYRLVGRQVRYCFNGVDKRKVRIPDFVYERISSGSLLNIEVKAGNGDRTKSQVAKDNKIRNRKVGKTICGGGLLDDSLLGKSVQSVPTKVIRVLTWL